MNTQHICMYSCIVCIILAIISSHSDLKYWQGLNFTIFFTGLYVNIWLVEGFPLGYFIIFLSGFYPNLWYFDCYYAHCLYWCTLVAAPDSWGPRVLAYCCILASPPTQYKYHFTSLSRIRIRSDRSRYRDISWPLSIHGPPGCLLLRLARQGKARRGQHAGLVRRQDWEDRLVGTC